MPKINKYQIINFKYGMDGNRLLSDKIINLNGDHLQMEATNSVGKSMSIQTLIQAICPLSDVNKKFIDIYNVKEPIYTIIEWILDDNKTKLLTGIGFEKKSIVSLEDDVKDKKSNLYKFFTFTIEECADMNIDIENIEIYKNENGIKTLKSLSAMDTYIKTLKTNYPDKIAIFGQHSQAQSKYRDKLAEYGIFQSEWKEILIKLNGGEAVLSSFFEEYNTTEKFMKNKVLPLIDNNLNKSADKNSPIKQLREQVRKFIEHCIQMDDKIKCYDDYSTLLNYTLELKDKLLEVSNIENSIENITEELSKIYYYSVNKNELVKNNITNLENYLNELDIEYSQINYEDASFDYFKSQNEINRLTNIISNLDDKISDLDEKIDNEKEMVNILKYQDLNSQLAKELEDIAKKESDKEILTLENEEISQKIDNIGFSIKELSIKKEQEVINKIDNIDENILSLNNEISNLNNENINYSNEVTDNKIKISKLETALKNYNNKLNLFNSRYLDINSFKEITLMGELIDFPKYINHLSDKKNETINLIKELEVKGLQIEDEIEKLKNDKFTNFNLMKENSNEISYIEQRINVIEQFETKLNDLLQRYELNADELSDIKNIQNTLNKLLLSIKGNSDLLLKQKIKKENELENFKNISNIVIDDNLIELLTKENIEVDFGFNYLIEMDTELDNKVNIINKYPILPYSIILTQNNLEKLKKLETNYKTKFSTPIVVRETLDDLKFENFNNVISINDVCMFASFDVNLLDNEKRERQIDLLEQEIFNIEKEENFLAEQTNNLRQIEFEVEQIKYVSSERDLLSNKLQELITKNDDLAVKEKNIDKQINNLVASKKENKECIKSKENELSKLELKINEVNSLNDDYISVNGFDSKVIELKEEVNMINSIINRNNEDITLKRSLLNSLNISLNDLKKEKNSYTKLIKAYQLYSKGIIVEGSIDELIIKLNALKNNSVVKNLDDLNYDINNALNRKFKLEKDMSELKEDIKTENILDFVVLSDKTTLNDNIKNLNIKKNEIIKAKNIEIKKLNKEEGALEHKASEIAKKYKKEPLALELIVDYDFKKRRNDLLNKKDLTQKEIEQLRDKKVHLDQLIKDLRKYKTTNIVVVEMDDTEILNTVDTLVNNLYLNNENKYTLLKEISKVRDNIDKFNLMKNDNYRLISQNLISDEISVNSQLETINKVEIVLTNEIDKVKNYKENLDAEKTTINKQIKDYLSDCIDELRVLNKLGRVNGEMLFNIALPDTDKINYLIIEDIVNSLCISKNVDEIDSVINSFYLLNKLINISNLKIKVVQYELNNKKAIVNWDKVIKSTSGGQRFCISFIILTILMEYKRYNSKELSHKSTGKVLIMDNPFGETSEEDFLRLVFKLADKFQVQIISYTHVTNASIRVQFNRIYRMTVEKTANNKEIVVIDEDKNSDDNEIVKTNNYIINNKSKEENLFDLIK